MNQLCKKFLLPFTSKAMFLGLVISAVSINTYASSYTLQEAIERAKNQDPWILGSINREESLEALSHAARSLPDPIISVGMANLPVDTFDFSQEAMTQFRVGINQMFPRGKTRLLKQERLEQLSQIQPEARQNRQANVEVIVSHLWLEAYRNELIIQLIKKDRRLFEHLVEVSQFNYTSATGRTKQQDIVRAQLELTRLDDRLTQLRLNRDTRIALLGEWLNDPEISLSLPKNSESIDKNFTLVVNFDGIENNKSSRDNQIDLEKLLSLHPLIKSLDWKIRAFETDIDLAKQSYKPKWGINASYGYRDKSLSGEDRSDFYSVGVTFDVPLFKGNRQDKTLKSAHKEYEAVKTERSLALRKLKSKYESAQARYRLLNERHSLLNSRLLKEIAEQAEASLVAYTNDNGDFDEVVRARIAELNARIDAINIVIDLQKNMVELNYFGAGRFPHTSS